MRKDLCLDPFYRYGMITMVCDLLEWTKGQMVKEGSLSPDLFIPRSSRVTLMLAS